MTDQVETQLTLNDFVLIVNIIDACSERGAIKGNELATVGALRDKLSAFVAANTPNEDEAAESTETEETGV